jgi:hypothetical protein
MTEDLPVAIRQAISIAAAEVLFENLDAIRADAAAFVASGSLGATYQSFVGPRTFGPEKVERWLGELAAWAHQLDHRGHRVETLGFLDFRFARVDRGLLVDQARREVIVDAEVPQPDRAEIVMARPRLDRVIHVLLQRDARWIPRDRALQRVIEDVLHELVRVQIGIELARVPDHAPSPFRVTPHRVMELGLVHLRGERLDPVFRRDERGFRCAAGDPQRHHL